VVTRLDTSFLRFGCLSDGSHGCVGVGFSAYSKRHAIASSVAQLPLKPLETGDRRLETRPTECGIIVPVDLVACKARWVSLQPVDSQSGKERAVQWWNRLTLKLGAACTNLHLAPNRHLPVCAKVKHGLLGSPVAGWVAWAGCEGASLANVGVSSSVMVVLRASLR